MEYLLLSGLLKQLNIRGIFMAGFLLFLFCSICSFIAAKSVINSPGINEKVKNTEILFFILFGIANLFAAFSCLIS